jgi:hypothetical protein
VTKLTPSQRGQALEDWAAQALANPGFAVCRDANTGEVILCGEAPRMIAWAAREAMLSAEAFRKDANFSAQCQIEIVAKPKLWPPTYCQPWVRKPSHAADDYYALPAIQAILHGPDTLGFWRTTNTIAVFEGVNLEFLAHHLELALKDHHPLHVMTHDHSSYFDGLKPAGFTFPEALFKSA